VRIGIDIGGTFTDFVYADDAGGIRIWKEDTTPADPSLAVMRGLGEIARQRGTGLPELLSGIDLAIHGTTIATNTLIQRTGPVTGLLCTAGFRDILHLRDGYKSQRFNVREPHPGELVPRALRRPVRERIAAGGEILSPLHEEDVVEAAAMFRAAGVQSVAIAFLWSVADPRHEERAAAILAVHLPGIDVICSHQVLSEMREWQRTSAALISAYVRPALRRYLTQLEGDLASNAIGGPLLVLQNNGHCSPIASALARPVNLVSSGPAAAPAAARHHTADLNTDTVIVMEIGGTSCEVSTLRHGEPALTRVATVAGQPLGVASVDVTSIGAGGGSIAALDPGGALTVGPRSAGALPGPACYGQGGTAPTVTDAHVILGTLAPDTFLAGRRTLHPGLAHAAIEETLAIPLRLSVEAAAAGIISVAEANMVNAIRTISVGRGIDPRACAMLAGGGAGGLHASRVARRLGIGTVVIPKVAGALCAFGMLVSDVGHEDVAAQYARASTLATAGVDDLVKQLDMTAVSRLIGEGFGEDQISLRHAVDARYVGQAYELTIPLPAQPLATDAARKALTEAFHRAHQDAFTYARPDVEVEFLHWRVISAGIPHRDTMLAHATASRPQSSPAPVPAASSSRVIFHPGDRKRVTVSVYQADSLPAGTSIRGPALLQSPTTTVAIDRDDLLLVHPHAYVLELSARMLPIQSPGPTVGCRTQR
jgi:N-methylhydantoinase A